MYVYVYVCICVYACVRVCTRVYICVSGAGEHTLFHLAVSLNESEQIKVIWKKICSKFFHGGGRAVTLIIEWRQSSHHVPLAYPTPCTNTSYNLTLSYGLAQISASGPVMVGMRAQEGTKGRVRETSTSVINTY